MSEIPELSVAVLLIGDELLSGRTRDINLQNIAQFLAPYGLQVSEARVISDKQEAIVENVNDLRNKHTYVFTTGGIGPTHDDITADSVAVAFGVEISEHPDVIAELTTRYKSMNIDLTPARRRMARIPHGASLIKNPVSGAPGFQIENVFVLAGVPKIANAMLGDVGPRLQTGEIVHSLTVKAKGLREGDFAESLSSLNEQFPEVSFGSYPWFVSIDDSGVSLIARTKHEHLLEDVQQSLENLVRDQGKTPIIS